MDAVRYDAQVRYRVRTIFDVRERRGREREGEGKRKGGGEAAIPGFGENQEHNRQPPLETPQRHVTATPDPEMA